MKNKYWWPVFFLSLVLVALGQPDRHPIFATLAYVFGYSSFFWLLLQIQGSFRRFLRGFLWAGLVQLFQLNWFATTYYHGYAILYVYVFLSLWLALELAILTTLLPKKDSPSIMRSLAIASVWVLFEWSRLFILCGFPFNSVGLVLTFHHIPLQMASIVGIYGLSFWVVFTACLGARAWQEKTHYHGTLWLFMLGVPFIVGYLNLKLHDVSKNDESLHVALIQVGLPAEKKWITRGKEKEYIPPIVQWKRIMQFLEERGKERYDLIVLPEATVPGDATDEIYSFDEVVHRLFHMSENVPTPEGQELRKVSNIWIAQAMANHYQCEVIAGFLEQDDSLKNYNSAFHLLPNREGYQRYDKRVLVPLTEYVPFEICRAISASFGIVDFFTAGKESTIFQGKIPYAVSICYEEIYSNIIREGRLKGAKMFVNLTNDGWFPYSRLPIEHFNLGRVRAVENGVPVLRACNTGVSAAIDCFGRVITSMDEVDYKNELMSGAIVAKVSCKVYDTIFSRFGNGLIVFLSLVIIALHGGSVLFSKPKYTTQVF